MTDEIEMPVYTQSGTVFEQWMKLSIDFTGDPAANVFTAFAQWQEEREAMASMFDENQAYQILNRRLLLALKLAEKAITQTETDAVMFITPKARDEIEKFRGQVKAIENTIKQSEIMNNGETYRTSK